MVDDGRGLFDERLIGRRRLRRWAAAAAGLLILVRLGAELVPVLRVPDLVMLDTWQSLRATRRPSRTSSASYTTPMPPPPRRPSTR